MQRLIRTSIVAGISMLATIVPGAAQTAAEHVVAGAGRLVAIRAGGGVLVVTRQYPSSVIVLRASDWSVLATARAAAGRAFAVPAIGSGGTAWFLESSEPRGGVGINTDTLVSLGRDGRLIRRRLPSGVRFANRGGTAVTADGRVWFTRGGAGVGVFDPHAGTFVTRPAPAGAVVAGARGDLWFFDLRTVRRYDVATRHTTSFALPDRGGNAGGLAVTPDDDVVVAERTAGSIAVLEHGASAMTACRLAVAARPALTGVAVDGDDVWVADAIGRQAIRSNRDCSGATAVTLQATPSTISAADGNVYVAEPERSAIEILGHDSGS